MELLMGNEAIAMGALAAGVQFVSGYPGTPSTEVLETVAKRRPEHVYVEWSVNEKAALEVAAGAALAGARAMVTMKQVGLNVASDPLMCLNYIGVKGALVVVVADDPGPISSQTEQDTRHFARYARIPVFDPQTPEQAYRMVKDAFEWSEKYHTPVILRPTTRVCHGCAAMEVEEPAPAREIEGFVKDDSKWVIFPRTSFLAKKRLFAQETEFADALSEYSENCIWGEGKLGIATGGGTAANNKEVTEAGLMGEWLKEHGVDEGRLIIEDASHTTAENARFSYNILLADYPQVKSVALVSSSYHIAWGSLLFEASFLKAASEQQSPEIHVISNAAYPFENEKYMDTLRFETGGMLQLIGENPLAMDYYMDRYTKPELD